MNLISNKTFPNIHYLDTHIGQRIRMRRLLLNITLCEIASQIKVSYQQIQKYEKGINRVSASLLYELSKILNINIEYFYDGYKKETLN
jgi:transcriptional regulator with XRE-family HTH domain